jgi:hypothetical protein
VKMTVGTTTMAVQPQIVRRSTAGG